MTVTDQIQILNRKIKQNEVQYDLDKKSAKISALSSNNLDKYEYLTGEDLKPSAVEQVKFEYSPLGKIFNKGLDKEDKKEGILKRLKNIEKNQYSNNNNDKSELSSVRSKSSKKISVSDDETQTSFEYLKDNRKEFFKGYPDIFDLDLKEFYNYIPSQEEKYFDCNLLLEQILLPSGDVLDFFDKYCDLYNFWTNVLLNISSDVTKLWQINFLKDLMNGFSV